MRGLALSLGLGVAGEELLLLSGGGGGGGGGGPTYGDNVLQNGTFTGTFDPWVQFEASYDLEAERAVWAEPGFATNLFQQTVVLETGFTYALFCQADVTGGPVRAYLSAIPAAYITIVGYIDSSISGPVGTLGPVADGVYTLRVRDSTGASTGWMDNLELRKVLT